MTVRSDFRPKGHRKIARMGRKGRKNTMKKLNKVLVLVMAVIMTLAMSASVFAAVTTDSGKGGAASITISLPKDTDGNPIAAGTDGDVELTYTVYKVFDATSNGTSSAISYKIDAANGDLTAAMTSAGFTVDAAGNVSGPTGTQLGADAIAAIKGYAQDEIGTLKARPSDGTLKITGLQYGYYYITTTTGSAVTVDSTNPNATVEDKNSIPTVDKKITGASSFDADGKKAIAEVGTDVDYQVEIVVGKGAIDYVFHDVMDSRLSYNNDVAVDPAAAVKNTTTASGDTITVTFDNDWLAANEGETITVTYSAKITAEALTLNPAKNTATLDYGEGNTTDKSHTEVYTAKFTVTKQDGDKKPLANAGFVIKNKSGAYYKLNAATATASASITWYTLAQGETLTQAIADGKVTEYKSDAQGAVPAFTGLANGTYTLEESTVPDGYNKAADQSFTIAEHNYTAANLEQTATVTNKPGTVMPGTGGIGTTIFYILGSLLVVGCGIVLISRKRMQNNK